MLKSFRSLGASLRQLADSMDKIKAPEPIHHNGKDYYPDSRGWYDIECAPKDGTVVLISGGNVYDIEISRYRSCKILGDGFCSELGILRPTHWQPKPQPPVEKG